MTDSNAGWVQVCATAELLPGEKLTVWLGDTPVLLVNCDGEAYALEDRCSHQDFELSAGEFDAAEASIECTLHGAKFDVRDGRALCAPAYTPVHTFPLKMENGAVWIRDDRS